MSMHRIPLTELERAGLKAHGLDIGKPSQLSDAFRQGVAWQLKAVAACTENQKAIEQDLLLYGTAFTVAGKHVPFTDVVMHKRLDTDEPCWLLAGKPCEKRNAGYEGVICKNCKKKFK